MDSLSLPLERSEAGTAAGLASWLRRAIGVGTWRRAATDRGEESPAVAAQRVRDYANRLRDTDPRMAADLLAAADRHERLHER